MQVLRRSQRSAAAVVRTTELTREEENSPDILKFFLEKSSAASEPARSSIFTQNGIRLLNAFVGIYMQRVDHDVYSTIGFEGANDVEVNFGLSDFFVERKE